MVDEYQAMTLRLPTEVHEQLRRLAFERRTSINALVVGYVVAGLENEAGEDKPHV